MNLIERYVYDVTKNLSVGTREDVGRELRSNIEEMLPENATDNEIHEVLEKIGNPSRLADEYNPKKRYLMLAFY
ncbi:MAG TPA: hypothetical protein VHP81_00125 [Lachnospiraceae bacterium]|nr:hypothetical protein [Lachnospiraceae bacterium]